MAESQLCWPKGQDSKSVQSSKSNGRHSASGQVVGNKPLDFFVDLASEAKLSGKKEKGKKEIKVEEHAHRLCKILGPVRPLTTTGRQPGTPVLPAS